MSFFDDLENFGDNEAVIDPYGGSYSYKDLGSLCDRFADCIAGGGKKLLLVLCENRIEPLIAYIAALMTGNVSLLVDAKIDKSLLDRLTSIYRPDYVWGPKRGDVRGIYEYGQYILVRHGDENRSVLNKELSLLLSTSGSTGSPKLVRLTEHNLLSNAMSISEYLRLDHRERPITTLPMHYSYGLSVVNSHLRVGATILLTPDTIMTRPFWDFFKGKGATSFSGVPYTYEMLKKLKFFSMDLPSLRIMTQAGGRLDPKLVKEFAEFSHRKGIDFFVMYGQTEATARISYLPPRKNLEKFRSVGVPIPGGRLMVFDEEGREICEPNVEGELVYQGANVMLGYAESREDLANGDELKGTLMTGDIGYFDEDGFFFITGRKKRFIKVFGNRVNLDDIETFLREEGFECACDGSDDHLTVACIKGSGAKEIKKRIIDRYGFHHSVIEVGEVDEIVRSSSGKVRYEEFLKRAEV